MLAGQILNLTLDPTRQAGKKSLLLENEMFFTYRAHFKATSRLAFGLTGLNSSPWKPSSVIKGYIPQFKAFMTAG